MDFYYTDNHIAEKNIKINYSDPVKNIDSTSVNMDTNPLKKNREDGLKKLILDIYNLYKISIIYSKVY